MENRIIGMITLLCLVSYLGGCTTGRFIPVEEYQKNPEKRSTILAVMTTDSTLYEFRITPERVKFADGKLTGKLKNGEVESIPLADVKTIKIQTTETGEILLWTGLALVSVVALAAIVVSSMDFDLDMNWQVEDN